MENKRWDHPLQGETLKRWKSILEEINNSDTITVLRSRHTVVCRAAQENGACANGGEYINRTKSHDFHAFIDM